jgi:VanZ family protein
MPIVMVCGVIMMISELTWVPKTSPWGSVYMQVDKVAHVIMFTFFGLFVARYLSVGVGLRAVGVMIMTASLSVTFGLADELHQVFVQNRNAELGDLIADLVGGLTGAAIYLVVSGAVRWTRELLCSAEVGAWTIVGRAVVALTVVVSVTVFAVIHASPIAEVCRHVLMEASLQMKSAVKRHLARPEVSRKLRKVAMQLTAQVSPQAQVLPASVPQPQRAQAVPQPERQGLGVAQDPRQIEEQLTDRVVQQLKKEIAREIEKRIEAPSAGSVPQESGTGNASEAVIPQAGRGQTDDQIISSVPRGMVRDKILQALATDRSKVGEMTKKIANCSGDASWGRLLGASEKKPQLCDSVAVIAHPDNPINELTVDQVRKLFSGEHDNWSQVGGPDLPVRVVTVRKPGEDLEGKIKNHLRAELSPEAVRLPLVSLIIPTVAETKGALGFVPIRDTDQLAFVVAHKAFKSIALKSDEQSQVVRPHMVTLNAGVYPIMNSMPAHERQVVARQN